MLSFCISCVNLTYMVSLYAFMSDESNFQENEIHSGIKKYISIYPMVCFVMFPLSCILMLCGFYYRYLMIPAEERCSIAVLTFIYGSYVLALYGMLMCTLIFLFNDDNMNPQKNMFAYLTYLRVYSILAVFISGFSLESMVLTRIY